MTTEIKKVESIIIAIVLIQTLLGNLTTIDAENPDHHTEVRVERMTTEGTAKNETDPSRHPISFKQKSKSECSVWRKLEFSQVFNSLKKKSKYRNRTSRYGSSKRNRISCKLTRRWSLNLPKQMSLWRLPFNNRTKCRLNLSKKILTLSWLTKFWASQ